MTAIKRRSNPDQNVNRVARKLCGWLYVVQPGGTGPTRLKLMVPDSPLLLPPVKL